MSSNSKSDRLEIIDSNNKISEINMENENKMKHLADENQILNDRIEELIREKIHLNKHLENEMQSKIKILSEK